MKEQDQLDVPYLNRLFPRLQAWYNWFNSTQEGPHPLTYRWKGRNETTDRELNPKVIGAGLHQSDLLHVMLRHWPQDWMTTLGLVTLATRSIMLTWGVGWLWLLLLWQKLLRLLEVCLVGVLNRSHDPLLQLILSHTSHITKCYQTMSSLIYFTGMRRIRCVSCNRLVCSDFIHNDVTSINCIIWVLMYRRQWRNCFNSTREGDIQQVWLQDNAMNNLHRMVDSFQGNKYLRWLLHLYLLATSCFTIDQNNFSIGTCTLAPQTT